MPLPLSGSLSTNPITTIPASTIPSPSCFSDSLPLPKILVFDLDYTLWPLWVDTHVSPPLKRSPDGLTVQDGCGEKFGFYKDVAGLLVHTKDKGMMLGAASRTSAPDVAERALRLLTVPLGKGQEGEEKDGKEGKGSTAWGLFDVLEIYPGDKKGHFERIRKKTGLPFEDMLFFDDERRNKNVEQLGVTMRLVRDGVTVEEVERGVGEWRARNGRQKPEGQRNGEGKGEGEAWGLGWMGSMV